MPPMSGGLSGRRRRLRGLLQYGSRREGRETKKGTQGEGIFSHLSAFFLDLKMVAVEGIEPPTRGL